MVSEQLQKKIDRAVRLLQSIPVEDGEKIEVAYSGGKDSDVILQLAKESGIPYRAIYKNTTIDPPGTISHVKAMGAEVLRPKENFGQLIQRGGFPNMFKRFCCQNLKEYKVLDKAIHGVRRSESRARADRYSEPQICRYYGSKKPENHVQVFLPILDWTDEDVLEFIKDRQITLAPVYYDENGEIDITRRLGCMCCPLQWKGKRLQSFKKYPGMVRFYLRNGEKFRQRHPDGAQTLKYADVYEWFVRDVFYDSQEKWEASKGGLFDERPDYKKFLEDYFNITL